MTITPIFIFSAPRSGSTLLQRVLAAHSQISTASEPWLLLPLISPLYAGLPAPGARDPLIHEALEDFISRLPRRRDDYRAAARELALQLYARAADGPVSHFVDKTPLYHLVVDEILATFPDGKFLFLFRNPLSVVASCVELLDGGRWEVARYHMALFQSFVDLTPAARRYASRSYVVRFEDLLTGDETPWQRIIDYLELPWESRILDGFSTVQLQGRMGDPTGIRSYTTLTDEPVTKWRATISNPLRRAWCARYLQWLGADRLAVMGYELEELQRQLATNPVTGDRTWDDARIMAASLAREVVKARLPRYTSRASTWRALLQA